MTQAERILEGAPILEMVCRIAREAIRSQNADATEAEIEVIFQQRLNVQSQLDALPPEAFLDDR